MRAHSTGGPVILDVINADANKGLRKIQMPEPCLCLGKNVSTASGMKKKGFLSNNLFRRISCQSSISFLSLAEEKLRNIAKNGWKIVGTDAVAACQA